MLSLFWGVIHAGDINTTTKSDAVLFVTDSDAVATTQQITVVSDFIRAAWFHRFCL